MIHDSMIMNNNDNHIKLIISISLHFFIISLIIQRQIPTRKL